jgi:hypothetical protein
MSAGCSCAGHRREQRSGRDRSRRPVRQRVLVRAGEGAAARAVLQGRGVQWWVRDQSSWRGGATGELAVDVQADARQELAGSGPKELRCCRCY